MDLRERDGFPPLVVELWGPAALFTRPEAKVERVSYPVMTPSAAVGVLEAIFWKPEFTWQVVAIEVLAPIREGRVRRNETTQVVPRDSALRGERVNTADHRTQRASTILLDVRYRVHAHVVLRDHATDPVPKYRDQFRRRVDRGACFSQPYFGTREFPAAFGPASEAAPVPLSGDLGVMLHSIKHGKDGHNPQSSWFTARLDHGVLHVPEQGITAGGTT
ncbi:MAG: type I-C CRISPR-associated protein Cas5c [Brooklawnia sp.]|uniref:type I-C CRISPR-associated protein Cas5c n=1 Tax=Brooklawnia sp. TaxID=2699740 RepID=UPI003C78CB36